MIKLEFLQKELLLWRKIVTEIKATPHYELICMKPEHLDRFSENFNSYVKK